MSEENKKEQWSFTVVFHAPKEDVEKLRETLLQDFEPDVQESYRRVEELLEFMVIYTQRVHNAAASVNFDSNPDFSDSPQSVIRDIQARSEFVLKHLADFLEGRVGGLKAKKDGNELDDLLKTLLFIKKYGEKKGED